MKSLAVAVKCPQLIIGLLSFLSDINGGLEKMESYLSKAKAESNLNSSEREKDYKPIIGANTKQLEEAKKYFSEPVEVRLAIKTDESAQNSQLVENLKAVEETYARIEELKSGMKADGSDLTVAEKNLEIQKAITAELIKVQEIQSQIKPKNVPDRFKDTFDGAEEMVRISKFQEEQYEKRTKRLYEQVELEKKKTVEIGEQKRLSDEQTKPESSQTESSVATLSEIKSSYKRIDELKQSLVGVFDKGDEEILTSNLGIIKQIVAEFDKIEKLNLQLGDVLPTGNLGDRLKSLSGEKSAYEFDKSNAVNELQDIANKRKEAKQTTEEETAALEKQAEAYKDTTEAYRTFQAEIGGEGFGDHMEIISAKNLEDAYRQVFDFIKENKDAHLLELFEVDENYNPVQQINATTEEIRATYDKFVTDMGNKAEELNTYLTQLFEGAESVEAGLQRVFDRISKGGSWTATGSEMIDELLIKLQGVEGQIKSITDAQERLNNASSQNHPKIEPTDPIAPEAETLPKVNEATAEHIKLMEDAARAEVEKLEVSKRLAKQLSSEESGFKKLGEAIASIESVGSPTTSQIQELENLKKSAEEAQKKIAELETQIKKLESSSGSGGKAKPDKLVTLSDTDIRDFKIKLDKLQLDLNTKGKDSNYFDSISKSIEDARNNVDGFAQSLGAEVAEKDVKALDSQLKELGKTINSLPKTSANAEFVKNIDTERTMFLTQVDKQIKSWSAVLSDKPLMSQIDGIKNSIISVSNDKELKQAKNNWRILSNEIAIAGKNKKAFADRTAETSQRLAAYVTSLFSLQRAMRFFTDMVNAIKEIDAAQVRLQRVTDLSGESLKKFTDRAFEAGQAIGRTGKDLLDAVTEFRRAGFELEQSFQMGQIALVMTNIGDGIRSVEDASFSLIAVLRGFNFDESQSARVVDAINEVANTSPIGFANISEGLRRVSGTLSQTGASLEETIGLLTGGFASLRNIESVSSGLVMLSQRLRGVNEDGEAIEGLAPKTEKAFKEIAGIDIKKSDGSGELRSTYEIVADMARIFPTLTDMQRQYLGEMSIGNPNHELTPKKINKRHKIWYN